MSELINKFLFVPRIHRHYFSIKEVRTNSRRTLFCAPLSFVRFMPWVPSILKLFKIFTPLFLFPIVGLYISWAFLKSSEIVTICWACKHHPIPQSPLLIIFSQKVETMLAYGFGFRVFLHPLQIVSAPQISLGTSENRMRSLRHTAMLNYNTLYLHNILKYTVSYKGTYLIIF